jgi:hypothetical protein
VPNITAFFSRGDLSQYARLPLFGSNGVVMPLIQLE